MINNNFSNNFRNYMNRSNNTESGSMADNVLKRLKARQASVRGTGQETEEAAATDESTATQQAAKKTKPNYVDSYTKSKSGTKDSTETKASEDEDLTTEQKRQKELAKIMEQIEAEEAMKYPNRTNSSDKTNASSSITTTTDGTESEGVEGFLNDLPLFNEFKTGLMDAFKNMDSSSQGSISAQYELNYSSIKEIATANGYERQETSVSMKFDLEYVKAAAGGKSGTDIASAIENAQSFDELMDALEGIGSDPAAMGMGQLPAKFEPTNVASSMQDYFGSEATAGRILDFATSFFPLSDAYKKGGDTPEAREEFAELMRNAVQKGFDQAMGTLGSVGSDVQSGIDKTHELVFQGFDDFVKNGMSKNTDKQNTYNALQQLSFNFEMNVTQKSVSVSNYNTRGETSSTTPASSLDAQA